MCFTAPSDYEPLEQMDQVFSTYEYQRQSKFPVNVRGVRIVAQHLLQPWELHYILQVWKAYSLCRDTAQGKGPHPQRA